ncbi:hypothetical protein [Dialister hominis]|uniref:hypothetical protein n=1 Tax=Dialister hominis TaxID=2582419 RepID=UPI003522E8A7
MITRLYKGNRKREVIISKGVGPYSGTLKVVYWLESDEKGIMDTKWHDQVIEHIWAEARARHRELMKQFMEDGWQEQNGLTMEEVLAAIQAAKAEDAPTIRRTEKQLYALRAKGGRTAQARARARKAAQ